MQYGRDMWEFGLLTGIPMILGLAVGALFGSMAFDRPPPEEKAIYNRMGSFLAGGA